jgi:CBS domain-containing protein
MDLLNVARVPPVIAAADISVLQAVALMAQNQVGAIVITDSEKKILGIFTERDNMLRVTLKKLNPETTLLSAVMTAPVHTAPPTLKPEEALERMLRSQYRHLPVVDKENRILGMVSVRTLLMRQVSQQQNNIETLEAYVEAGGPG